MFDLEGAIALWRKRLSGREAFAESDLDEMEGHLRDEIDALIAAGVAEKDAFFQAVHGFGENLKLAWRFNQANWEKVMAKRTRSAPILIGNYFKVAVRNLLKYKAYSFINISGLALGIACCILVLLFVKKEWGYDTHHVNADHIYRVVTERINKQNGQSKYFDYAAHRLAPALKESFPEIQQTVRMQWASGPISHADKSSWDTLYFVDPSIFEVFSLPFLSGDPETALREPFTAVLTKKTARKFFGDENPMGKTLAYDDAVPLKVTGVLENLPANTHLRFDLLTSSKTWENRFGKNYKLDSWDDRGGSVHTYLLLSRTHGEELQSKLSGFIEEQIGTGESAFRKFHVQALTDIHLYSKQRFGFYSKGDIRQVYLLLTVAFIILTIACFNYVNLSTARSTTRAREVGMRKVAGAHRFQIAKQFLGESILISLIAFVFGIGLAECIRPLFNELIGSDLRFNIFEYGSSLGWFLLIALSIGVVAGFYPALFLSAFQPIEVLKGAKKGGSKSAVFRKVLVTFQFAMCIILMIATGTVYDQISHLKNVALGFEKDHIIAIPHAWKAYQKQGGYEAFQARVLSHPNVKHAARSSYKPFQKLNRSKKVRPEGTPKNEDWSMQVVLVDQHFFDLLNMKFVKGRNFSSEFSTDLKEAVILNQAAVKTLGWSDPIDKTFETYYLEHGWKPANKQGRVIGVVKNTHFESLHHSVRPTVFTLSPDGFDYYLVKVGPKNISETISFLESTWKKMAKGSPLEYAFLNERFDALYRAEEKLNTVYAYFAMLGILVACMGLFGLAAFVVEQKTKEIGIRKTLGASIPDLTLLLSKDFMKWILLSNLIAWPVAYYIMQQWLQDFAHRIDLGVEIFGLAGALALIIAFATVGYQTVKASRTNPVDVLHHE